MSDEDEMLCKCETCGEEYITGNRPYNQCPACEAKDKALHRNRNH